MIAAQKTQARTLADWLVQCGWQPRDRLRSVFTLDTDSGEAVLSRLPALSKSQWNSWTLESPFLPIPDLQELFAANREIQGPFKFTVTGEDEILCAGDVPREALVTEDSYDLGSGRSSSPIECWARSATALAKGETPALDHAKPTAESQVEWLKEHGYVASCDREAVKVTVPLTGTFREITVSFEDGRMVHLSAEIGRIKDWPAPSREAAVDFLGEANSRLRLIRIAEADEPFVYRMEARFCAPGPGVWLQAALDAFCTGMALVVQPLATLRDPGVADMLLAGKTARRKGGAS